MSALEDSGRLDEAEALAWASVKEQLGDALRRMAGGDPPPPGGHALIIDGKALTHALGDDTKDSLLAVRAIRCPLDTLLCCSHDPAILQHRMHGTQDKCDHASSIPATGSSFKDIISCK